MNVRVIVWYGTDRWSYKQRNFDEYKKSMPIKRETIENFLCIFFGLERQSRYEFFAMIEQSMLTNKRTN